MNRCLLVFVLIVCTCRAAGAEELSPELLASWVAMEAPTGHEERAMSRLQKSMPGWVFDKSGNLKKTVGQGSETTVVACLLDAPSFTVSQITADGYLRLHHVGRSPEHALWSQAHEGQQLRIITANGPVVGVTALANGHFMNLHRDEAAFTTAADLWLDVGAATRVEVAELGISLLDPVVRNLPAWFFADWVAGPAAGSRLGCAALVAAAEGGVAGPGSTTYVMTTKAAFSGLGLTAALSEIDNVSDVIVLGPGVADGSEIELASIVRPERIQMLGIPQPRVLSPVATDAGALMERLHVDAGEALGGELLAALGSPDATLNWQLAPGQDAPINGVFGPQLDESESDPLDSFANTLKQLGELAAVSGHEGPVRDVVYHSLPPWAQALSETDEMGNLWVEMGPSDAPATVFIAHMDEVGWEVSKIAEDGTVDLRRMGGALALAREGQPAVMQLNLATGRESSPEQETLRGVFLTRQDPQDRWPETLQAWFGHDATALAALGVRVGMPVTGYKEGHRLARHRFTVRGMDDRVGTAALLAAIERVKPKELTHRVIFAWSVQEEVGLLGAAGLARRFANNTRRVYSIDTFVSSDTPLEAPHFAYAPLGAGPVLRSMESSGMVTRDELSRNQSIAAAAGVTAQLGMTQGGTDGTAFTLYGAPNAGLSWPGRYSHGPAELGDLRDMLGLVDLIVAFAEAAP